MARSLEKNHPESGVNSKTVTTPAFPLADLPDLVLLNVANQLSNDDARNLSLTCMRFQVTNYLSTYVLITTFPFWSKYLHCAKFSQIKQSNDFKYVCTSLHLL